MVVKNHLHSSSDVHTDRVGHRFNFLIHAFYGLEVQKILCRRGQYFLHMGRHGY
jgi:hypothetical protein